AAIYSTHAVALTISKLFWGSFLDKFHVRHCGMAAFVYLAAATASLVAVSFRPSVWLVYLAAILIGFGLAGQAPIQEVLWANYFGRLSLGAIRTVAAPITIIFSAGGPLFGGWAYDRFGSYKVAFVIFAVTYLVAAGLVYLARQPVKTPQVVGSSDGN
ncbi:MAG: MFS transporter, partial [Dehalococcoidia bacterium]|nr:MFS transporter [Dehalococcoidia bacterium]